MIARYELGGDGIFKGYLSAFHNIKKEEFRSMLVNRNYSHLLVHSQRLDLREVLGVKMNESHSYLLEANRNGGWKIIKNWEKP